MITPEIPTLSDDDDEHCEGDTKVAECSKALASMNVGKSLGIGLTLVKTLHYSLQNVELSQSQRQGVITLLQKKGNDPTLINNLRSAVSLTNTNYKILTKSLSNRTENLL